MARKALVLLIALWTASNFGCTGLKAPNLNTDNILDFCKVTFITGSVDIGPRENSILIIKDDSVQISSSDSTIDISLAAITHVGPSDSMIMDFPTPLSPNYGTDCPDERAGFPIWLIVAGLALFIIAFLWIKGVFSLNQAVEGKHLMKWVSEKMVYIDLLLDMDFMVDGVKNFATLQMTQKEFNRIYPLLLEKTNLN